MAVILLIAPDPVHLRRTERALLEEGFDVITRTDGVGARAAAETEAIDLIVLDLTLPDADGIDLCRRLRVWPALPIIAVSDADDDELIAASLNAGADDCVPRSIAPVVLVARIGVQLRHAATLVPSHSQILGAGSLRLDTASYEVDVGGESIQVNVPQFTILRILVLNVGKCVTHHVLARALGRGSDEGDRNAVRISVSRLRHELGRFPGAPEILTVWRQGYCLVDPRARGSGS